REYDSDASVREQGAEVVIPSKRNRLQQREIVQNHFRDRNKVERFFKRVKAFRRVAARCDQTADSFAAFVYLALIMILLH
ncbi:MAG: transposase, partial [Rufibacter sp.]